jgi:hypothetical protein
VPAVGRRPGAAGEARSGGAGGRRPLGGSGERQRRRRPRRAGSSGSGGGGPGGQAGSRRPAPRLELLPRLLLLALAEVGVGVEALLLLLLGLAPLEVHLHRLQLLLLGRRGLGLLCLLLRVALLAGLGVLGGVHVEVAGLRPQLQRGVDGRQQQLVALEDGDGVRGAALGDGAAQRDAVYLLVLLHRGIVIGIALARVQRDFNFEAHGGGLEARLVRVLAELVGPPGGPQRLLQHAQLRVGRLVVVAQVDIELPDQLVLGIVLHGRRAGAAAIGGAWARLGAMPRWRCRVAARGRPLRLQLAGGCGCWRNGRPQQPRPGYMAAFQTLALGQARPAATW